MERPNILVITTDQHNAEIMGCAGNPVARTPHLDRLAGEGVRFDQAFTPHCVCTPARTSIFTGQTARLHGVNYNLNLREDRPDPTHFTGLPATAFPFPRILAGTGYDTSFFGKLHAKQAGAANFGLRFLRLAEGKGQFVEYGTGPDDYRRFLREKGYDDSAWRTWEAPGYAEACRTTSPLPPEDTIDVWTATEAVRYLEEVEAPFCSWVSFSGPHPPWDPPRPYDSLYDPAEIPLPARRRGELEEKCPRWVNCLARTIASTPPRSMDPERPGGVARAYARFSDEQVRAMLAAYYGQITLIDEQIGRLLEVLDARGLSENTVILFTADHGDHLGNNWAFYKYGAQYDSLARVPFLLRWPAGGLGPGGCCREMVSLVDIAPTLLEAAATTPVDPVEGESLLPLLRGERPDWRRTLCWSGAPNCVMTADWKYLRWPDGFEELYNRVADPHDLYNLALDPDTAALRGRLGNELSPCR